MADNTGKCAFALRAEFEVDEGYPSIGTTLAGGASYNVGQALAQSDGVIVTNDGIKVDALRNIPALKEISLSEAESLKSDARKGGKSSGSDTTKKGD